MKRTVAASVSLISLVLTPLLLTARPAAAHAVGGCTISGTITFSEPAPAATPGRWAVSPGTISCRGMYNGWERIINPGSFSASGTYTAVPTAAAGCAVQLGEGTVDYWLLTSEQDIHYTEPHAFTPGAAGAFTTPSLRGTFQLPPDAGCLSGSADRKGTFLAEVSLVRAEGSGLEG